MLPGEIFPTDVRATCHGISAMTGKLGALLAGIFFEYMNIQCAPFWSLAVQACECMRSWLAARTAPRVLHTVKWGGSRGCDVPANLLRACMHLCVCVCVRVPLRARVLAWLLHHI